MTYADVLELSRRQPRRIAFTPQFTRELSTQRTEEAPSLASSGGKPAQGAMVPMTAAASFLAYLGAAPLLAGALSMVADRESGAARFLVLYGAALLIFFGGVRWGVAVMKPQGPTMRALLGAVLPMLAALPLFVAGDPRANILIVMALMIVLLADDLRATRCGEGAPAWYLGVRVPLTVLIEVALLVALAAGVKG
jgi:hypothetical protein